LATINMGRKLGALSPVWGGGADRTDRQDNGPIAKGEPFYKRSPKIGYDLRELPP